MFGNIYWNKSLLHIKILVKQLLNLNLPLWNFTWKCHIFRSDLSKLFSGDSSFVGNRFPIQSVCHITGMDTFVLEGARKEQIQCEMCQIYLEVGRPPTKDYSRKLFTKWTSAYSESWVPSRMEVNITQSVTPLLCQMVKIMSRKMWIMYGRSCHQAPHPFPSDTSQTLVTRCRRRVKTQQAP